MCLEIKLVGIVIICLRINVTKAILKNGKWIDVQCYGRPSVVLWGGSAR